MKEAVEKNRYYLVAGRMGDGTDTVFIQLFVNDMEPKAEALFPVNLNGNPSRMAVGQEEMPPTIQALNPLMGKLHGF